MRSKYMYMNSTSSRKFLTENGFSDIDFLYDVEILAGPPLLFAYYGDFSLHTRIFDRITTST